MTCTYFWSALSFLIVLCHESIADDETVVRALNPTLWGGLRRRRRKPVPQVTEPRVLEAGQEMEFLVWKCDFEETECGMGGYGTKVRRHNRVVNTGFGVQDVGNVGLGAKGSNWWLHFFPDNRQKKTQKDKRTISLSNKCSHVVEFMFFMYGSPSASQLDLQSQGPSDGTKWTLEWRANIFGIKSYKGINRDKKFKDRQLKTWTKDSKNNQDVFYGIKDWQMAAVFIERKNIISFNFQAPKKSYESGADVDEIAIYRRKKWCTSSGEDHDRRNWPAEDETIYHCGFEKSVCMEQAAPRDYQVFKFGSRSGQDSSRTGPHKDTGARGTSFFGYVDARQLHNKEQVEMSVDGLEPDCLSTIRFHYNLYGESIGPLTFMVRFPWEITKRRYLILHIASKFGYVYTPFYRIPKKHLDFFYKTESVDGDYMWNGFSTELWGVGGLRFRMQRMSGVLADSALDEVTVQKKGCNYLENRLTTTPRTKHLYTPILGRMAIPWKCDFEAFYNQFCGMENYDTRDFQWIPYQHRFFPERGKYATIYSFTEWRYRRARLVTQRFFFVDRRPVGYVTRLRGCLRFKYRLNSDSSGALVVLDHENTKLWEANKATGFAKCRHESSQGMCMAMYTTRFYSQSEAQSACTADRGTLMTEEYGDVRGTLSNYIHDPQVMGNVTDFWIGGFRLPAAGWKWGNGSLLGGEAGQYGQWTPYAHLDNQDSFDEIVCVRIAPNQRHQWEAVNCGLRNAPLCHVGNVNSEFDCVGDARPDRVYHAPSRKCFQLLHNQMTWFDAKQICSLPEDNRHLASIEDAGQMDAVKELLEKAQHSAYLNQMLEVDGQSYQLGAWIGLNRDRFVWTVDGQEEIQQFNWDPTQDWSRGGCISYHRTYENATYYDYKWRVSDCEELKEFVCMYNRTGLDEWEDAVVPLELGVRRVVFEAWIGDEVNIRNDSGGDIAIDDVEISTGVCEAVSELSGYCPGVGRYKYKVRGEPLNQAIRVNGRLAEHDCSTKCNSWAEGGPCRAFSFEHVSGLCFIHTTYPTEVSIDSNFDFFNVTDPECVTCHYEFERHYDFHLSNGSHVSNLNRLEQCLTHCKQNDDCYAFDFDRENPRGFRCYIHKDVSRLVQRSRAQGIDHFVKKQRCGQEVRYLTTQAPPPAPPQLSRMQIYFTNKTMTELPWTCNFGDETDDHWCGFEQSEDDDYDVQLLMDEGDNTINFVPESYPKWNAMLISPMFPEAMYYPREKCLSFLYRMRGTHPGSIQVYDEADTLFWTTRGRAESREILYPWRNTTAEPVTFVNPFAPENPGYLGGEAESGWITANVVLSEQSHLFVFEFAREENSTRFDGSQVKTISVVDTGCPVPPLPTTVPLVANLATPRPRLTAPNFTSPHNIERLPWWCDFGTPNEVNTCNMTHDNTDRLDFVPNSGGTWTKGTGPPSDGYAAHGTYMLFEVSSSAERQISPGENARLISPNLPHNLNGYAKCLVFSMNVHGKHIGKVRVLDEYAGVLYEYVGNRLQNQYLTQWLPVSVQLDPWQELFVIEAEKGGVYETHGEGDICIDDLSLTMGECDDFSEFYPESLRVPTPRALGASTTTVSTEVQFENGNTISSFPFECTFQRTESEPSTCGFTQDDTTELEWKFNKNGTRTPFTGPPEWGYIAHGFYMYLEVTSTDAEKIHPGFKARLISGSFPEDSLGEDKCLVMNVSAYGWAIGELNILDELGNRVAHYHGTRKRNRDNVDWFTFARDLRAHQRRFVIEGVKGGVTYHAAEGDLAIDDVKVLMNDCTFNGYNTGFPKPPSELNRTDHISTTPLPLTRDPRLTLPPTRGTTPAPRYIGTDDDAVFTNPSLLQMPFKCDFGDNLYPFHGCGFTNVEGDIDDFDWTPGIYQTATAQTGPPEVDIMDHLVYYFAEATGRAPGDVAYLVSPSLPDSHLDYDKCLTFNYNTYGFHFGAFRVLDQWNNTLFKQDRTPANTYNTQWQKAEVGIPPKTRLFVFAAWRGGNRMADDQGDISVDDIIMVEAICYANPTTLPPPPEIGPPIEQFPWVCSFDAPEGGNATWCYFLQDQFFQLKWTLHTGATPTPNTGIANPNPGNGYALMEATGVEPGMKAQIISPPLTLLGLFKCLSFKFNLFGAHSGELSVLDENFESFRVVRNHSRYSSMNGWHEMKLDIPGEWRRFVIEASRGGRTVEEDEGDISVDDFTLELSRCTDVTPAVYTNPKEIDQLPFYCTFGVDRNSGSKCDFIDDEHLSFTWTLQYEGTPTEGTGPPPGGQRGGMICAIASNQKPGAQARLISLRIAREAYGLPKCLSFVYHMFGNHPGMIQLLDEDDKVFWRSHEPSTLFEFKRVEVKLPLTNLFVFEAVRGGLTLEENEGDICVDSVHIYTGKCNQKWIDVDSDDGPAGLSRTEITYPWRCDFGLQKDSPFDFMICSMTQSEYSDVFWRIGMDDTPSDNTGPPPEYTRWHMAFAYMEATGAPPGSEARLFSPFLGNLYLDTMRCLVFQWSAYGQHVGTLRVTDRSGRTVFWEMPNDLNLKERKWYNTSTTIPHSFSYFVFEATRGGQSMEEDEGDIAIDDVFLYIGQCEVDIRFSEFRADVWINRLNATDPLVNVEYLPWKCDFELTEGFTSGKYACGFYSEDPYLFWRYEEETKCEGKSYVMYYPATSFNKDDESTRFGIATGPKRFVSPNLPLINLARCIKFEYFIRHTTNEQSRISILDSKGILLWHINSHDPVIGETVWRYGYAQLHKDSKAFVIILNRMVPYVEQPFSKIHDMAIDNIEVTDGGCRGSANASSSVHKSSVRLASLPWSCDFTSDGIGSLCGFATNFERSTGAILVINETTRTAHTGPPEESLESHGYYAYLEASNLTACSDEVYFISPRFPVDLIGEAKCLSFDYNMIGRHLGTLTVRDENNEPLWRRADETIIDDENVWLTRTMTLAPAQRLFVFEFTTGGSLAINSRQDEGDIAIDNIRVTLGSCLVDDITTYVNEMPMVLPWDCDFGLNITDADVCGFEQDLSDDFDWTPNIGATPSKFTGPPEDSFEAHQVYLYMEATGRLPGDKVRLISPTIPDDGELKCLMFYYNIYGQYIGKIAVLDGNGNELWMKDGRDSVSAEDGKVVKMYVDWMDVYVTLSESIRNFVIEGTRGGKAEHYSINDICIDNFTVSTGPCAVVSVANLQDARFDSDFALPSLPFSCDFGDLEPNLCNFTHDRASKMEWLSNRGRTVTDDTGPVTDLEQHALYMYMEASDAAPGDNCRLVSPLLPPVPQEKCLEFMYNLYGKFPGSLRVRDQFSNVLWSRVGYYLQEGEVVTADISAWKKGAVPIGEEVRVFVFEATRGGLRSALQDAGDVAIDDVLLKEGACAEIPTESISYSNAAQASKFPWYCDFGYEKDKPDWCDMKQDTHDHKDWQAWQGLSPAPHTGPPANTLVSHEVYAMFHTLTAHHPGERAAIVSPQIPNTGSDRCLGFEYVARGPHVGGLGVKTADNRPIWTLEDDGMQNSNDQMGVWHPVRMQLPADLSIFAIEGVRGGEHFDDVEGDIDVDNMFVTLGKCDNLTFSGSDTSDSIFNNPFQADLPWSCTFGESIQHRVDCSFVVGEAGEHEFDSVMGTTDTTGTGPSAEESSQHGVYALFEASGKQPGSSAFIISPNMGDQRSERCLSFAFSAHGAHVGNLSVLDQHGSELWHFHPTPRERNKLANWVTQEVDLAKGVSRFVMRATRGGAELSEDEGDIAIDDLRVTNGSCSGANSDAYGIVYQCSFELDFCDSSYQGEFQRASEARSTDSGPQGGAKGSGYFLYFDGKPADETTVATFTIKLEWQCLHIMTFSYYLYGFDVKAIRIRGRRQRYVKTIFVADKTGLIAVHDYRVPKDRLISRSQETWGLEQWHTYSLRVYSFEQVDIIATGSDKDNDDVGIDEIEILRISCENYRPHPRLIKRDNVVFSCGFERDFCGLPISGTWYRGRRTDSINTGPVNGARNTRYFIFLEADAVNTESIFLRIGLNPICSHYTQFAYFIYGAHTRAIFGETFNPGNRQRNVLFSIFRNGVPTKGGAVEQGFPSEFWGYPVWRTMYWLLGHLPNFLIRLTRGVGERHSQADLAIDELEVLRLPCPALTPNTLPIQNATEEITDPPTTTTETTTTASTTTTSGPTTTTIDDGSVNREDDISEADRNRGPKTEINVGERGINVGREGTNVGAGGTNVGDNSKNVGGTNVETGGTNIGQGGINVGEGGTFYGSGTVILGEGAVFVAPGGTFVGGRGTFNQGNNCNGLTGLCSGSGGDGTDGDGDDDVDSMTDTGTGGGGTGGGGGGSDSGTGDGDGDGEEEVELRTVPPEEPLTYGDDKETFQPHPTYLVTDPDFDDITTTESTTTTVTTSATPLPSGPPSLGKSTQPTYEVRGESTTIARTTTASQTQFPTTESEETVFEFDECTDGAISEGIFQSEEDDGDWMCGKQTELVPNSGVDRGNVLYVEGSAFLPEYWIELSLEAHSSYKCISFFHATHQELYWILVLTQSDFYNVKYLLTLTPIEREWTKVGTDLSVRNGERIIFTALRNELPSGENGILMIDEITLYSKLCRENPGLSDALIYNREDNIFKKAKNYNGPGALIAFRQSAASAVRVSWLTVLMFLSIAVILTRGRG